MCSLFAPKPVQYDLLENLLVIQFVSWYNHPQS